MPSVVAASPVEPSPVGASSLEIVPVAVQPAMVAPTGLARSTTKFSSGSTSLSPVTVMEMVFAVSPAAKRTVPDGTVPPKSSAFALSRPKPATDQSTDDSSETSPLRVTRKVKVVAAPVPSLRTASVAAMSSVGRGMSTVMATEPVAWPPWPSCTS